MIKKLNEYATQLQSTPGGNTLTLILSGDKVSVNVKGPRGGNEQVTRVDGDSLLKMLDAIGGISTQAARNYVGIVLDGCCAVCGDEINQGEHVCCDCLDKEITCHKLQCQAYQHENIKR